MQDLGLAVRFRFTSQLKFEESSTFPASCGYCSSELGSALPDYHINIRVYGLGFRA